MVSVPTIDPTGAQNMYLTTAEVKALGLSTGGDPGDLDGYVGFGIPTGSFGYDYSTSGQTAAGMADFVGLVEHEFSEVMGRSAQPITLNSPLRLYSYSAQGVLAAPGSAGSYFSADGGQTRLADFNNAAQNGGDYGDWAPGTSNDAFLAAGGSGATILSATDITVMKALGWQTNVVGTGTNITGNGENDLISQTSSGTLNVEQLNSNGTVGNTVQAGNNTVNLNSADAGASVNLNGATVVLGNGSSATVNGQSDTVTIGSGIAAAVIGNALTVTVGTSSAATVSGSGNTIRADAGDGIGVVGNGNTLTADAYTTATDYGNSDTMTVGNNSYLTVFGNRDGSLVGNGSTIALAGTLDNSTVAGNSVILISGASDIVNAYQSIYTVAISGVHNTVTAGANTVALDIGNSNTINAGTSSAITDYGISNTNTAGTGSTLLVAGSSNLFQVNPFSAYVLGSNGIDTLKGTIAQYSGDLINGLASGMHIDVTDLIPSGATVVYSGSASAGVLTFTSGGQSLALNTYGAINPGSLVLANDGNNGTLLTYS